MIRWAVLLGWMLLGAQLGLMPGAKPKAKPVYLYECKKAKQQFSYTVKRAHKCPLQKHKHYLVYVGKG